MYVCMQYSVGVSRDKGISGENCSEVGAISLPFYYDK